MIEPDLTVIVGSAVLFLRIPSRQAIGGVAVARFALKTTLSGPHGATHPSWTLRTKRSNRSFGRAVHAVCRQPFAPSNRGIEDDGGTVGKHWKRLLYGVGIGRVARWKKGWMF